MALTAKSKSSEHSSSSSEHKSSNGSKRTQTSVGPKTNLISKLRSLAAIHCKWIKDIGCARLEMTGEHRFTHFCLGSVDTRSKQVDTSPRFQKGRSTLAQGRSTLVPDSRRPSCQTGTAGRHTPDESQNREFLCTRGCLRFRGFDLGFHAHAPQSTLWTYGAINTHVPCTPKEKESPYTSRRSLLAAKGGFPDLSLSPKATSHPFKRKDKGIKGNPWREGCCARQGSRSN
ncbi:hypothetical protein Taro_007280 [Colocasia esculenta]|uniref:Uncharacterized protein n=1 Tax=Colocasia esculenta TaxID=4460 RepID=A0A843TUM7_COLES|nr:hypothetical protein [Colocasia esculenta]